MQPSLLVAVILIVTYIVIGICFAVFKLVYQYNLTSAVYAEVEPMLFKDYKASIKEFVEDLDGVQQLRINFMQSVAIWPFRIVPVLTASMRMLHS